MHIRIPATIAVNILVLFAGISHGQQKFYIRDMQPTLQTSTHTTKNPTHRVVQHQELVCPPTPMVPIVDVVESLPIPLTPIPASSIAPTSMRPQSSNPVIVRDDFSTKGLGEIQQAIPSYEAVESRLENLRQKISGSREGKTDQLRDIDKKIARLRRLFESKRQRELEKATLAKNQAEQERLRREKATQQKLADRSAKGTPARPSPKSDEYKTAPVSAKQPSTTIESLVSEAVAVTDKPVDRIALANNLFATGELSLALKIYTSLKIDELKSSDQVWVQYQMAGCNRRLGNTKRAESIYRGVAAAKSAPHWANRSRWWLSVMNKTARIKQRQINAVNTLVKLKDASDELLANNE